MLEISDLSKRFGNTEAVKAVSFRVKPGEIYCLIGPNGSGKTTIVKAVAGLLAPDAGRIAVGCRDIRAEAEAAKAMIGYIPDEPAIWPGFTGEEFLNFTAALFSLADAERSRRIAELLAVFSLAGVEKGYFHDYSRGNKQKFAIMAALLHRPKLLLVDEPIVGLDPSASETAQAQFKKFAQAGGAVLLVTHTLPVAQALAARIGVLKNGRLIAEGSVPDLAREAGLLPGAPLEAIYKALSK